MSNRVWAFFLESLPHRYTDQMREWLVTEFEEHGADLKIIEGRVDGHDSPSNAFLDWAKTSAYKASQVEAFALAFARGEVKDGDRVLFADLWHHGLEALPYMAQLSGVKLRIFAIHHAGCFDFTDLVRPLYPWAKFQEAAWIQMCERVFVGSEYLRGLVVNGVYDAFGFEPDNIAVTGLPWRPGPQLPPRTPVRGSDIYWPHRWSVDKNPAGLLSIARAMPGARFVITREPPSGTALPDNVSVKHLPEKQDYYKALSGAAALLSTAYHENFGYTIREAHYLGVPVIVPNRAAYPEFVGSENRYDNQEEAELLIAKALAGHLSVGFVDQSDGTNAIVETVLS